MTRPIRVCAISNSHLACLKLAWDDHHATHGDIDLRFFGRPIRGLARLKVDHDSRSLVLNNKGALNQTMAMSAALESSVEVDKYDLFFVFGLFFKIPRLDETLSQAVCEQVALDLEQSSIALAVCRQLRSLCDTPILVNPVPLPAKSAHENAGQITDAVTCRRYENLLDTAAKPYRSIQNCFLLPQPQETMDVDLTTHRKFSVNAIRFDGVTPHNRTDTNHMNAKYGEILLNAMVTKARTLCRP